MRRTASARSTERSLDHGLDSGWADTGGSRYSQLLSRSATAANVDTSFGWDSPSYSIKGSFPRAMRASRVDRPLQPAPGPTTYNASIEHKRTRSPRTCIGNSPRDTSQHFTKAPGAPGAGQYNPGHLTRKGGAARVRGGVIASSPRFKYMGGPPQS